MLFIKQENFGKMDNLHYSLNMRHNLRLSKHLPNIWNLCARCILLQVSASGAFSFSNRLPRAKSSIFFVICRRLPTPIEYYCG
jgi:hypothetical protein